MSLFGEIESIEIEPIRSKTEPIPSDLLDPSYIDRRFTRVTGGRTIFLAPGLVTVREYGVDQVEGAHYNYSDRLAQEVGHVVYQAAYDEAQETVGNHSTAAFYEAFLQRLYKDPTADLQHIIAGVNIGNGHPYQVYGTVSEHEPQL